MFFLLEKRLVAWIEQSAHLPPSSEKTLADLLEKQINPVSDAENLHLQDYGGLGRDHAGDAVLAVTELVGDHHTTDLWQRVFGFLLLSLGTYRLLSHSHLSHAGLVDAVVPSLDAGVPHDHVERDTAVVAGVENLA